MRVLVVAPEIGSTGGTGRFLESLLEMHRQNDFDTAVLAPSHLCDERGAAMVQRHGARLIPAPCATRGDTPPMLTPVFDLLFSWRAVRSFRPDLLVVSTAEPGRMSIALYCPVPVLYILHTIPESVFRPLPRLYLRLGSLLNNLTMTVSQAAAGRISETMGIPRGRIEVVHNAAAQPHPAPPSTESLVLTAGHLVPYKNPRGWLEVAQRVLVQKGGVSFVWLGDGELLAPLRDEVKALGLEERVLLPGHVPAPSPWYRRAQVYFQPSLRESHGIAVLDAMAHGIPCVVAATGGLPESVADNETGFICSPDDVSGFTSRILVLLEDAALRKRLGNAGRLRSQRVFSEKEQERKIMALYDRLVKKAGVS